MNDSNIPKILHFIWLGKLPQPKSIFTWHKHHSDWEIKIWDDEAIESLNLINSSIYFQPTRRYNQRSDVARLEILYKYGGVYVDADIINLKSINSLLTPNTDFFITQEKKQLLSNSVIGSAPNNPLLHSIILHLKNTFKSELPTWKTTGPKMITDYLDNNRIIIPINTGYDFKSMSKNVKVYPYTYFNFMRSTMVYHKKHILYYDINTITHKIINNNYDVKYVKTNNIKYITDNMYGIQLWMGGKSELYKKELKLDIILCNIQKYINLIQSIRNGN